MGLRAPCGAVLTFLYNLLRGAMFLVPLVLLTRRSGAALRSDTDQALWSLPKRFLGNLLLSIQLQPRGSRTERTIHKGSTTR